MLTSDQLLKLTAEMLAHLEEARRRGVDVSTVYEEELAAREKLAKTTPKNAELLRLADRFPAPSAWYEE